MKINKYFYILALLLLPNILFGQINDLEKIKGNEYLIGDPFVDIFSGLENTSIGGEDIADFSFNWGNSFDTALNNETLLRRAYDIRKRDWFNKQKDLIKENIEKELNETFDNYDDAKNALFLKSEQVNLSNNIKSPRSEYASLRSKGYAKSKAYSKELLLLKRRKYEIEFGSTNNSFLEGFKVNGIDLKDLQSIHSININWDKIEKPLSINLATTFVDNDIYKKINNLGIEFNNEIIRLKNKYYSSFDEWEQLNLMQFLLNYEKYKELAGCGVCIHNDNPFFKFKEIDVTTSEVIEEYAINNRDGGYSFFSEIGRDNYIGWPSSSGHILAIMKRQEYEKEKEKRLNALLDTYSIFETKDVDFLVILFNNSNSNEQEWLNYNPNRAKEMADILRSLFRSHGQGFGHYIYNRDLKPEIELGGKFVKAAIDFLEENPEYNFEQYENWFGTKNEGLDYEYDADYWEDPSLTFTPQDLPSWNDFNSAYPRKADGSGWLYGADNIYSLVGGDVLGVRLKYPAKTNNTCALKVSIALNGAGITIPQITTTGGGHGTVKGADGKNYFLNAKSLNAWMKLTFGTSPTNPKHFNYTAAQGGVGGKNFPSLIGNKKGIYSLTSGDPTWATGHADIFFENICAAGCHYNGRGLESIDIWVLD